MMHFYGYIMVILLFNFIFSYLIWILCFSHIETSELRSIGLYMDKDIKVLYTIFISVMSLCQCLGLTDKI